MPGLTGGEEDYGFQAGVLRRVDVQGLQFLHLLLKQTQKE